MSNFYAQINENKECVGVSQLSGPVSDPFMIPVDEYDEDLIGMTFANATIPSAASTAVEKAVAAQDKKDRRLAAGWEE